MSNTTKNTPSFLETFESLDETRKQALADIKSPLFLGLATLCLAEDLAKRQYLSGEHIIAALEAAGVAAEKTQITRAFSRAGGRISRKIIDEEIHYRLMTLGRRDIEPLLSLGSINISFIESGQPRSARKTLAHVFGGLKGEIRLCDPYYGLRTLEALEMIPKSCKVFFLTAQTSEKQSKLSGPFSDFKRERPKTELRLFPDPKVLHDRYLLSDATLYILGHGIKDVGNKDSFIVSIAAEYAGDLLTDLRSRFDDRWRMATPI